MTNVEQREERPQEKQKKRTTKLRHSILASGQPATEWDRKTIPETIKQKYDLAEAREWKAQRSKEGNRGEPFFGRKRTQFLLRKVCGKRNQVVERGSDTKDRKETQTVLRPSHEVHCMMHKVHPLLGNLIF